MNPDHIISSPPDDVYSTTVPNKNDVLCGRGGTINSHPGNEQYRSIVDSKKRVYLTARFKREKRLIATSIVDQIRNMDPPGRFLQKDADKQTWFDIGEEKSREKTSQALRENSKDVRVVKVYTGPKNGDAATADASPDNSNNNSDGKASKGLEEHDEKLLQLKLGSTLLQSQVTIQDRTYKLQHYPSCFIGSEAVDLLLQNGVVESRSEAVSVLQTLMTGYWDNGENNCTQDDDAT